LKKQKKKENKKSDIYAKGGKCRQKGCMNKDWQTARREKQIFGWESGEVHGFPNIIHPLVRRLSAFD
jgi:hypothetical protein